MSRHLARCIIGSVLAALIAGLGSAWPMRRGLRPIEAMAAGADRITAGDLTGRVSAAGQLPRIFDRFYRAGASSACPGSGLGLAIVTAIAAAHGGTTRATPNQPHGLCITVTVPSLRRLA